MTTTRTPPGAVFAHAHGLFDSGEFLAAAALLAELATEYPDDLAVRLLLARAYYHSAQLHRAESETRAVLAADPENAYAYLLLGRTLQRRSRHAEAGGPLRMAAAMGLAA
ncbi:tetratricopeptide repeat protein [Pseudonocardia petroleophila]|uniref:Tetratricopeptide repeat protein n=1 Tax=Pseudonocardia petroleophila TaxID=37331 RepID=A0A7G7MIN8_9PSEU|nr:tetratricopeptide repeat protein [Pseudonocardia petroleophila]QNG52649.1 tetratricopeptide repeat protein [Pseudonocardia petroleophila]